MPAAGKSKCGLTRTFADNRRQNRPLATVYRMLRFTYADIRDSPDGVVSRVRSALDAKAF